MFRPSGEIPVGDELGSSRGGGFLPPLLFASRLTGHENIIYDQLFVNQSRPLPLSLSNLRLEGDFAVASEYPKPV
jgi:hypothetical protein